MKRIYHLFICFSLLTLTSCDKFLNVVPDSSYSIAGAYKTQTDFEQAIAAIYSAQQGMYSANVNLTLYVDMLRSDEMNRITPQSPAGYIGGLERYTDDANNGTTSGIYNSYYKIINRCNTILDRIDGITFIDENMKKYIKGEALAFRAYSYWNLGWQFGGVPLITKVLTVSETMKIARSTQAETFTQAITDYNNAITLLPDSWTGKYKGRITKYAAKGILARIYMFQKDWAKAKVQLKDIISSGLYSMETDYKNCFTESHENGTERIWEVQFMGGQLGEGQQFSTGLLAGDYSGVLQPFPGFSSVPLISPNFMSYYEAGDLRKDISCVTGVKWNGVVDTKNYFVRKYLYADVNVPKVQNDYGINLPILRYTDVKLMYAEALNEEAYSSTNESFTYLNDVRSRAGLSPVTTTVAPDQASFRKAIQQERKIEFAFEGNRMYDLIRWGIAVQTMNTFLADPIQDGGKFRMKDNQVLYPIPFDELNRYADTKVLWQNPGY